VQKSQKHSHGLLIFLQHIEKHQEIYKAAKIKCHLAILFTSS